MRSSFKTQLIKDETGTAFAVYAESDFCAEHEQGLGALYSRLGCGGSELNGINRYRPSMEALASERFFTVGSTKGWSRPEGSRKKTFTLKTLQGVSGGHIADDVFIGDGGDQFKAAFSDRNFALIALDKEAESFIDLLAESAKGGDIAVFMGGGGRGNPFGRGGLVVAIPSLCPRPLLDNLHAVHVDTKRLHDASLATGIVARVKEKADGQGWNSPYFLYAISPSWSEKIASTASGAVETEYDVIYWLNNGKDIYGWFTVEDIEQWLEGHGPIIDADETRKAARAMVGP